MNYNARWFEHYITQFTQPDSIIPDLYNPLDWNRYAYGRYNPVKNTDPTGHRPCSDMDESGKCVDDRAYISYEKDYRLRLREYLPDTPSSFLYYDSGDRIGVRNIVGSAIRVGYLLHEVITGDPNASIDWQHNRADYGQLASFISLPGPREPLQPYEVGSFKDLQGRSQAGDGLDIHHAPPKQPGGQILPNYDPDTAPAIAVPSNEHININQGNNRGPYPGTPIELFETTLNTLAQQSGVPPSSLSALQAIWHSIWPGLFP